MRRFLRALDEAFTGLIVFVASAGLFLAAYATEIPNTSVFSQTDANNNSGTQPSFAEGQAPSSLNDGIRALQGAITRNWNWDHPTLTSGGSANTQTLTFAVAPAAYYNGQRFCFEAGFSTSGAATLNVNTLGAIALKYLSSGSLTDTGANTIRAGDRPCVTYRSTGPSFVIENIPVTSTTGATTTEQLTGTSTTVFSTPDSVAALWEKGSDIASAGTISIGEGGFFHVTGTTTITDIDFGTAVNGRCARLEFDGALILTHNSTTLVLPTGANITTAAGDQLTVCQDSGDNVHITNFERKSGSALVDAGTVDRQTVNADGTWTRPTGSYTACLIEAWGGGGSGGNRSTTGSAGGGGGGAYNFRVIAYSSLGGTETVDIGAGGAAIASSNANGNNGNVTTFGTWLSAYGGGGGGNNSAGSVVNGGGGGGLLSTANLSVAGLPEGATGLSSAVVNAASRHGGAAGGGVDASNNSFAGGASLMGAAGGGGTNSGGTPANQAGGTAQGGGNGGAASSTGTATSGSQPGGGGGAARNGQTSGAGGDGRVVTTCW